MRTVFAAFALALLVTGSAVPLDAKPAKRAAAAKPWDATFTTTAQGYTLMGNPAAPVKVIEFLSYTCPHCAHYSEDAVREFYPDLVRKGQVSVEMRPVVRVDIDLVPSMLATCGLRSRHFATSHMLFQNQATWLQAPSDPNYEQRWQTAPKGTLMKMVAKDLGLYSLMLKNGFTAPQVDACLSSKLSAQRIQASSDYAFKTLGMTGTPGFAINGKLTPVYSWHDLQPLIVAALPAKAN